MRAWIYNRAMLPLTNEWYRGVLERLPNGSRLLDIGIGTAGALIANADLVHEHDLRVVGVDIDRDYVKKAQHAVRRRGLAERVDVRLESIYEHAGGPYDAAYFAASFMLMPDPSGALRHALGLLRADGRVFFTQTFEERKNKLVEKAKPLLVKVTTIDFGRVTYEEDFLRVAKEAGLEILENETLKRNRARSFRRVVGRPLCV